MLCPNIIWEHQHSNNTLTNPVATREISIHLIKNKIKYRREREREKKERKCKRNAWENGPGEGPCGFAPHWAEQTPDWLPPSAACPHPSFHPASRAPSCRVWSLSLPATAGWATTSATAAARRRLSPGAEDFVGLFAGDGHHQVLSSLLSCCAKPSTQTLTFYLAIW